MSSESRRVALIFGAVAAAAAGAGFYFFKIYRPKQVRQEAQAEIVGWETRFKAARDCLLGPTPGSSKTSEALALREMSPDPWNRGGCTPLISKLSRGEGFESGLGEVEAAWSELDKAASKAATAFATHVGSSTTLIGDPLPAALDALDAARAKLRSVAGMPTDAQAGKPLPAAKILAIKDGDAPVTSLEIDAIPSAHGLVLFGKTASRQVQINLITGGAPLVGRVAPGAVRAVPDASWGASPGQGELRAGAFDAEGAMPDPTSLKVITDPVIAAVVGTPAAGELVYGGGGRLAFAHAMAGAFTAEAPFEVLTASAQTDGDGRAVVVWSARDKTHHGRILKPGADGAAIELPAASASQPCLAADRAWMLTHDELLGFGGEPPLFRYPPIPEGVKPEKFDRSGFVLGALQGCTADGAILRNEAGLLLCTTECREAKLPSGAPAEAALTMVGGKLVALASHGSVLGVWREDAAPVFYGLPEVANPVMAHEWPAMALSDGKVIDVIARGATTFVVIRIPAT